MLMHFVQRITALILFCVICYGFSVSGLLQRNVYRPKLKAVNVLLKQRLRECIDSGIINHVKATTYFETGRKRSALIMHATIMERERAQRKVAEEKYEPSNGAWMPFAVISCLDDSLPVEVPLAGESYVVWRDPKKSDDPKTQGWSIMKDICPHRLAPLSAGRVDPDTGCIECPYHGWQFESDSGECKSIPQMDIGEADVINSRRAAATAFPVHITKDILWGFIPLPEGQASSYPQLPEEIMPQLLNNSISFKARDLPYSFDYLVENFMDPAHIPFAHHSLQGVREDGSAIPMTILTDYNDSSRVEVHYRDVIRGRERQGVVSFAPPCYYHFRVRSSSEEEYQVALIGLVVPTTPGKCRLTFGVNIRSPIFEKFPKWLEHAFSNRFVDTDLWVHEQERNGRRHKQHNLFVSPNQDGLADVSSTATEAESELETDFGSQQLQQQQSGTVSESASTARSGKRAPPMRPLGYTPPAYFLPTQSDKGVIAWRRWWARHMSLSPIFGPCLNPPVITRAEQTDRFESHTKDCKYCSTVLKRALKLKALAPIAGLLVIAFSSNWWMRLTGVLAYYMMHGLGSKLERAMTGADRMELISAAQFARLNKKT